MSLFHSLSRSGAGLVAILALAVFPAIDTVRAQSGPATAASTAQKPARIAMRDSATEKELQQQVAAATGMDAQMAAKTKPLTGVRPSTKSSLLTHSIILSDGVMFTLIPVGSVLNLPPSLRNRVIEKPTGTFTYWPSFLQRNSSWLAAKEVPLKMAKGDAKAGEAIMREMTTNSRVVVAVYKGGPISILEPVPEEKERKASVAKEAAQVSK